MSLSRRRFIQAAGAVGLASGLGLPTIGRAQKWQPRVVVIGGGFGGATAAKYIRKLDSSIDVTLIEENESLVTCPGSNWVLGGLRDLDSITHSYEPLSKRYGVKVVRSRATAIDADKGWVRVLDGSELTFDRLIVSPGIDFRWDAIEGYGPKVVDEIPHAYKAGPQTLILYEQLRAMKDGGTVIITVPDNPFRCPPGPYERASMIAYYLSKEKPKSKIIILDAKDKFSKQALFTQGWKELYGYGTDKSMIEWVPLSEGGRVTRIDPKKRIAYTDIGEYRADVLNVIPPQLAGQIAQDAGLTDQTGWCPIDPLSAASRLKRKVHVIGDASIAAPLPKSGYSANSEAKACAFAVVALLQGKPLPVPTWINTCYSLLAPEYGVSVAGVYRLGLDGNVTSVEGAGGVSPMDGNRKREARFAKSWYENIVADMLV